MASANAGLNDEIPLGFSAWERMRVGSFHTFAVVPAKNFINRNRPGCGGIPAHPARGVHAASTHGRPPARKISNAPARSDTEAG
jgi:hypothetical protein